MPAKVFYDADEPKIKEGYCPVCNSQELDYGNRETLDQGTVQEVTCLACKWVGQELCDLVFAGYTGDKPE